MPNYTKSIESMIFVEQTTTKGDYKGGDVPPIIKTKYKEPEIRCPRPKPKLLKDLQAMAEVKSRVPFDLFWRPKEILKTNPHVIQKKYKKPEDLELQEVRKTRPRLVMTPAAAIDNAADEDREIVLDNIYTTTVMDMMRFTKIPSKVRAPLSDVYASPKPIKLPHYNVPVVPPEWRMDTVTWDAKQLRSYSDSTRHFWLNRKPPYCSKCDESARVIQLRKRKQLP